MAVLWLILKVLLWILAGLLALLLAGLLAPAGAELGWSGEKGAWVNLRVFGVRIRLLPKKEKAEKKKRKKAKREKTPAAPQKSGAGAPSAAEGQADETPPSGQKAAKKAVAAEKRFELTLETIRAIAGAAGGFMSRVFAALRVHAIRVYLPVHRGDAAATALAVGRLHAAFGAALGVLQNFFRLKFSQYELEPDYTGEKQGKAFFSCKITAHPIIMVITVVWVLVRLKKEHII